MAPAQDQPARQPNGETPRDRAIASRIAQGLPAQVEDPVVLAKVAALLRLGRQRPPERDGAPGLDGGPGSKVI